MAASAYAFLVSLMNTMDQTQSHPYLSTCFDECQFESLREKVGCLLRFVENHSDAVIGGKVDSLLEAEDLLSRIAVVAQKAEDRIEVEAADRIRDEFTKTSPRFLQDLQKEIEEMDFIIKEEVIKLKDEIRRFQDEQPQSPSPSAPPATPRTATMVGFDGYLEQLLDELTGHQSSRRIIPVVGMGGIGKTTLARNVYQDSLTVYHFDVRVWVTISQAFCTRDALLKALSCLGGSTGATDEELGEELHKKLSGWRYLVVLDDMWSIEAWEKIQFFFPDNNNQSRILVTTREQQLVDYFGSSALALDFLDDKNSWDLFCGKTFAHEGFPLELEQVGRKIVKKCKGLPLAITVIGGLLGKLPRAQEYWEKIAQDKSSILEDSCEGNKAMSLLYLSYKHLPVWLKPCFLYLGLFPEDHQIDVSNLIKYLVAEGFIKPSRNNSLEELAESYITDLVDRNLLILLTESTTFGICCVHNLVRELCISIAEKENFYCIQRSIDGTRHFIVDQRSENFYPRESLTSRTPSLLRPITFDGQSEREAPFKSRLLRVLADDLGCLNSPSQEVNLRLFFGEVSFSRDAFCTYELNCPSTISLCWSLQTLAFHMPYVVVLPPEIWKMPQLRHVEMYSVHLPDPPPPCDALVLQNLQTLWTAKNLNLSQEACRRIPNIKKLNVASSFDEGGRGDWSFNLECLNKLESLQYYCKGKEYVNGPMHNLKLPISLKELGLWNCNLTWSDMKTIALLPHLEGLELHGKAVAEAEWNFVEEEFRSLKFLDIHNCHGLMSMSAESWNFPVLQELCIGKLYKLEEIPSGIGEIATLEVMELFDCSESATISAIEILEEQQSLGNQDLHLQLRFLDMNREEMWREKIQALDLTCQNLHISSSWSNSDIRTAWRH